MRLSPYCFATDSAATTIYGFALARKDGTTNKDFYNILFKSNPNPRSDLTDLTWTLISVSPQSRNHMLDFYAKHGVPYDCAIDDNGVFSVLSHKSDESFSDSGPQQIPRGLQFRPPSAGGSDKHVWSDIVTSNSTEYSNTWDSDMECPSQLFNFKNSAGQNNLMHVVVQHQYDLPGGVYVAAFDSPSSTMSFGSAWLSNHTKYGVFKAAWYTPGSIHSLSTIGSQALLTSIPITSSSTNPPVESATIRNVTATIGVKCYEDNIRFRVHTLGNSSIISCMSFQDFTTQIFVLNDTATVTVPLIKSVDEARAMIAVKGSDGNSFLFLHGEYRMYSHQIDGPSAGTRVELSANISISGGFGGGPGVPDDPFRYPSDSDAAGNVIMAIIVGPSVLGALAVACCIGCCVRRRRRQRRRESEAQPVPDNEAQPVPDNDAQS
ncbi:hypothetical protein K457DRAFT_29548 [Linnemannia elongata AG-77]|uniref:Uncharacterized protein n=1 Tax=Linnemannia elongata AG-77 TaxID=1314771 RepID=A0A197K6Q4_9FUNG|nr:hypothetical protein K457DRAFT_29548 [Linnemannia elongata AG-77]